MIGNPIENPIENPVSGVSKCLGIKMFRYHLWYNQIGQTMMYAQEATVDHEVTRLRKR